MKELEIAIKNLQEQIAYKFQDIEDEIRHKLNLLKQDIANNNL